jgi:coproporphyrinogen III oxidase
LDLKESDFFASGVSIVLHPQSPMMPIIHMNVRLFEMSDGVWWFGGGIDLTPHYIVPDDAAWFHQRLKSTCDAYHPDFYDRFKKWADDYFFIKHRGETRGIGGIFFDRLDTETTGLSKDKLVEFIIAVGNLFVPIYAEMATRNRDKPYSEKHKQWQLLRRGRYAEFNLVYDKGTKFGLDTDGRAESIMMSLPPLAAWEYSHVVEPSSAEAATQNLLKKDVDWVNISDAIVEMAR